MARKIQFRRDSAANWTSENPIMSQGEMGIELDAPNKFKIGDGANAWNDLPYFAGAVGAAEDVTYDNDESLMTAETAQDAFDELVSAPRLAPGCLADPTYTDNEDGTITVDPVNVLLYKTTTQSGGLYPYTLAEQTLSLTNNTTNYVVGKYNSGTPVIAVTTTVADINESDVIPIFTIYRNDAYLHVLSWDSLACGLPIKAHYATVKTERYRRQDGLIISVDGSRYASLTGGTVFVGANQVDIDAMASNTDTMFRCVHSGGTWTQSVVTTLENTYYDNGTNAVELTANRYAVNFVYRGVEDQKHMYITLGTGDYTLADALDAQPPAPPQLISSHAVLVGKVIYQKGSSTAYSVESAFDVTFVTSGVTDHGDLDGLTEDDVHPAASISVDASGFSGNLSATDTDVQTALETIDAMSGGGGTDTETVRRSYYFIDNPDDYAGGKSILDFVKSVQVSNLGAGKPKSTSGRYKRVYFDSITWTASTTQVAFKLAVEAYDETTYYVTGNITATSTGDLTAISVTTAVALSIDETFTIVFDSTEMADGTTYSGSYDICGVSQVVLAGGGPLREAELYSGNRSTDPYPVAKNANRLSPNIILDSRLTIYTVGAGTAWLHTNGDLRKFLFGRLYDYDASNWGLVIYREEDTRGTYAAFRTLTGSNSQDGTKAILSASAAGADTGYYTWSVTVNVTLGVSWTTAYASFAETGISPASIEEAYGRYLSSCNTSCWREWYGATRTDSNTLAGTDLEDTLTLGTHVRSCSGTTRPTTITDWKHHVVSAVGSNAVDVIGEEIPTGGGSLFVEYSTNRNMTLASIDVQVPGYWAYATGTSLLADQDFAARPYYWNEPEARLIGAANIKSMSADTGASQPTLQITAGGTDLLGSALSVNATATNTGVIASGQTVSSGELIDIDCESTGTNADSKDLIMTLLIARHV